MHVIVIGAGLSGLASAYYLRRQGADVTIIDRAGQAGMETSFANAGIIHCSMVDPWNGPGSIRVMLQSWLAGVGGGGQTSPVLIRSSAIPRLARWGIQFLLNSRRAKFLNNTLRNGRLANYSLQMLRRLRAETDIEYAARRSGLLVIHRSQRDLDEYLQLVEFIAQTGVDYKSLDRRGVVATEPALAPIERDVSGGVYFPNDEVGDSHLFCRALAQLLAADGVRFEYGRVVAGLCTEGARITGVTGAGKDLSADVYLVAAGSYTPQLLRGLGIRVPIAPAKGYSITMPVGTWENMPRMPIGDHALHAGVAPLGDKLRVAGTAEFSGYDLVVRPARIENLLSLARKLFPEFAAHIDPETVMPWAGLRPMCPDGVPIISGTPLKNLFINAGHGHLGWTMAAGSGRVCADLILGKQPALAMADYALERF